MSSNQETLLQVAQDAIKFWDIECKNLSFYFQSENTVYQVEDSNQNLFALRIHRPGYHDLDSLKSEHLWTSFLKDNGLHVPEALYTIEDEAYAEVKIKGSEEILNVGLVKWIPGVRLKDKIKEDDSEEFISKSYRQVGEIIAQMHNVSVNFKKPTSFSRHSWDEEGLVGENPFWGRFWEIEKATSKQRNDLLKIRNNIYQTLKDLPKDNEFSMIHADLHLDNILSFDDSLTVIDFDDSGFGWHACDLAHALWDPELLSSPLYKTAYESIVAGYIETREDSDSVIEKIELFLLIRSLMILRWAEDRKELGYDSMIPGVLELAINEAKRLGILTK
jgi:Ser/Thr protein kinase RdoA (MazF antagonist)